MGFIKLFIGGYQSHLLFLFWGSSRDLMFYLGEGFGGINGVE